MGIDYGNTGMDETLVVRLFPHDLSRLKEIVADSPEKYESISHAARCAIQHFIRKYGEIE